MHTDSDMFVAAAPSSYTGAVPEARLEMGFWGCHEMQQTLNGAVLESGTGSGSLTHSLARAVAPTGHVASFEFHTQRAEQAAAEFASHGLVDLVSVQQRDIEALGFPPDLHGIADAVFLDLPGPGT